jgi:hypothetical protein
MTMTVSPTENPLTLATVTVFCPDVEVAVTGVAVVLAIVVPEETVRSDVGESATKFVSIYARIFPKVSANEIFFIEEYAEITLV